MCAGGWQARTSPFSAPVYASGCWMLRGTGEERDTVTAGVARQAGGASLQETAGALGVLQLKHPDLCVSKPRSCSCIRLSLHFHSPSEDWLRSRSLCFAVDCRKMSC